MESFKIQIEPRNLVTMKKPEQALVTITAEYFSDNNSQEEGKDTPNNNSSSSNNKVLYYIVELVDFIKEKPF
ncbi:hypothetical protein PIB30_111584 [Stylosanthes scabra]|uniref:Uncharacterized protein n=1 Tax=Stylosanthes scabra TaxID=79078 RepID=A0ABU6WZ78_9FABA|nr:hypothetical protein [Stylosanthes scabra]